METLYRIDDWLVSKDLSVAYYYDDWAIRPESSKFRKMCFSGSSGSFGGRNICIGIDPDGNKIMSNGVWYHSDGIPSIYKEKILEKIKQITETNGVDDAEDLENWNKRI